MNQNVCYHVTGDHVHYVYVCNMCVYASAFISCRSRTRQENKSKGLAFLRAGNRQQALESFQKCIDITPEMALDVIKVWFLFSDVQNYNMYMYIERNHCLYYTLHNLCFLLNHQKPPKKRARGLYNQTLIFFHHPIH